MINGEEVAIKIKHPNIKNITSGQMYVINTLVFNKSKFIKRILNLHLDIEDFMYNLLLQLDFTNEAFNTLRFEKHCKR